MSSIIILRVFFFNVFLFICLSTLIYGQDDTLNNEKNINLVWLHEFINLPMNRPDNTLSTVGAYYVVGFLEELCTELSVKKNLVLFHQSYIYVESKTQEEAEKTGDNSMPSTTPPLSNFDYHIITTYILDDGFYRISSKIHDKANNLKKTIPAFKLQKFKNNETIGIIGDSLKTHAESIVSGLYEIFHLQFTKVRYYINSQPMKLPDSLSIYNKTPQLILRKVIDKSEGIVEEAKSDSIKDTILEVDLLLINPSVPIISVTINESSKQLAYSNGDFKRGDTRTYLQLIDKIAEDLAQQIKQIKY